MKVVIFAGGIGTRMWPVSRVKTPKQFNPVLDNKSTLELMYDHVASKFPAEKIYIGTNLEYIDIVRQKIPTIPAENIFGEPAMRDLGPAVGYALSALAKDDPDEPVAILWSDDLIKNRKAFTKVLQLADQHLQTNPKQIVYIGIKPYYADQNKGWIHFGNPITHFNGTSMYEYQDFHYRPPLEIAKQYFHSGEHAVNTGYFVSTPGYIMELYEKFAPEIFQQLKQITNARGTDQELEVLKSVYPQMDKISFDDLIIEKTSASDGVVLVTDMGWYGFGDWQSIKEALQESQSENITKGNVYPLNSENCLVYSYTDQLVTPIGLEDMTIVVTPDAIMICKHDDIPQVKQLLKNFAGTENEKYT